MHCCIITCNIPSDMPMHIGRHIMRSHVQPVLEEFGYVLPDDDLQQKLNRIYNGCTKECSLSVFLTDDEAIKTASVRAEWKPLDTTVALDKTERKALRKMSKRKRSSESHTPECHICLYTCKTTTTLECDHSFCYKCIKKWCGIKRSCPVCDTEINVAKYMREKRRKKPCKRTSRT